jgi:predicted DNA-binding transcriptional regulator AlpA
MTQLPETGFLRLPQIIGNPKAEPPIPPIIPVSKSTWWAGVKSRRYPQPARTLGARITAWRVKDIRALVEEISAQDNAAQRSPSNQVCAEGR